MQLGVVACSCNPATWRSGLVDGLRAGVLPSGDLCRSGVRTKQGINMVSSGEPRRTRLSKEGRTGPGWKHSRQKSPFSAVVGSRPWIGTGWQPVQYNGTQSFFFFFILFPYFFKRMGWWLKFWLRLISKSCSSLYMIDRFSIRNLIIQKGYM